MPVAFFTADNGEQLWETDGTAAGTHLIATLASSLTADSSFQQFGDQMYFTSNSDGPTTMWRSDGSAAGTVSVGQFGSEDVEAVGTQLYLDFSQDLATLDGATIGPTLAMSVSPPLDVGNQALFFVTAGGGANGLWSTDGTVAGTHEITDLSSPAGGMVADGKFFFMNDDPTNGWALAVTSGLAGGVTTLKTFPGNVTANFGGSMFSSGGKLYFTGNDGAHGVQLWVSDGTTAGTKMLTDLAPSLHLGSQAAGFTTVDGHVIFTATNDGTNFEVFGTDGTVAGTKQLTSTGVTPFNGGGFTVLNGKAYFSDGVSLYATDGTAAGTQVVANEGEFTFGQTGEVNGELVFVGGQKNAQSFLFLSNGTPQGTIQVTAGGAASDFVNLGGKLYFCFEPEGAGTVQLWVSDGTQAGTHQFDGQNAELLTRFGNELLFDQNNTPWVTDGTAAGTHQLSTATLGGSPMLDTFFVLKAPPPRADFDTDGVSDFLIQNSAGATVVGEAGNGVAAGGAAAAYTSVAALGSEWSFHGEGNFLGDGHDGFLIQNNVGAVVVGEVADGHTAYTQLAGLGSEWSFRGVGDYLGKGAAQFLVENGSGAVVVGAWVGGQTQYVQVAALGPEWKFVGTGDFLGDGRDDFLIQNTGGAVVIGEVKNGAAAYTGVVGLGQEWKFVGTGDFLGEGHSQFLIENSSGAVDIGDWSNGQIHFTQAAGLGPEWKFVGAGDYLGEGHDQFLIENSAGAVDVGDWLNGQIHFTQVASLGSEWTFH